MTTGNNEKRHRDHGRHVMSWHSRGTVAAFGLAVGCALLGYEGDATACGACFAAQSESTVVSTARPATYWLR